MAKAKTEPKNNHNGANLGFEAKLFLTADRSLIRLRRDGDLLKRFAALMTTDLNGHFQIQLVQETD